MRSFEPKRFWCAAAVAVLALAGTAQAQLLDEEGDSGTDLISASSALHPRLSLASDMHDLGSILQLDRPEFDYSFTNTGNGLLVISRVQSTCGCTVPELIKKEYKPGESGMIHVKYDPSGKHGPQMKQVHVFSNDPEKPELALTLKADVSPVVLVEPKTVNIDQVAKGSARSVILKVTGRTEDFAATYATLTRGEFVTAKILDTKPVVIDGKSLRQTEIELTISDKAPVGRLNDNVSVRTTDPREAVVFCPITATVVGEVKVEPAVLPFGVVKPGDPFKGTVKVASRVNKPFKITKAEVKQPNTAQLKLTATPDDPANPSVYTLLAEGVAPALAEGVRATPIQGYIVVTTDVDREGPLEIPFYVQPRLTGPATPAQPAAGAAPTPAAAGPVKK